MPVPLPVVITPAQEADLDELNKLFQGYLAFYQRPAPSERTRAFLAERIAGRESVVLLAREDAAVLGFVQLYPGFSSLSQSRSWLLNDLFVDPAARRRGLGDALVAAAVGFARQTGASSLRLQTQRDNTAAQRLYDRHGFVPADGAFVEYGLVLDGDR